MKKFLIQLGIFFIPFIFILTISDYIVTKGLQKTKSGDYKEWNEIYSGNINADIIINGSSRAWVHVSPKILDSILYVNSYNLGIDGHNFYMQYCKFCEYLQYNNKPKIIIQTLDIFTLAKRNDLYNYQQFFPYIYKSRIRKVTKTYKGFTNMDYNLPFYRYHNSSEIIKIGFDEFFTTTNLDNGKYKGYLGIVKDWDNTFDEYKKANPKGVITDLDKESIELMDTFLNNCKNDNINVILVYSPEYIENQYLTNNRDEIFKIYNDFAIKYDIDFFDYSKDTISYQKKYFYNSQHLNKEGAELFTEKLANDIKTKRITYNMR